MSTQENPLNTENSIRIYVASLSDYNAGELLGEWIELVGKDAEQVNAEIEAMLSRSTEEPAEEWAIHDYDGFSHITIHEYERIEGVVELAALMAAHGEAFSAWYDGTGATWLDADLEASFLDAYAGKADSEAMYAYELALEVTAGDFDAWPLSCIDWQQAWDDLAADGYWSVPVDWTDALYVFRS